MDCMQLDIAQYPYVDLSKMFDIPGCAVRVPTEHDAETILANLIRQYPNEAQYRMSSTWWGNYRSETAYSVWDTLEEDYSPKLSRLGFADVSWFKEHGYIVIEFDDLVEEPELEDGGIPLEFLMS